MPSSSSSSSSSSTRAPAARHVHASAARCPAQPLRCRHPPLQLPRRTLPLLLRRKVGVGTSKLQADMVSAGGYASIVNTDISPVAVEHMAALHKACPQLSYRVGDVR